MQEMWVQSLGWEDPLETEIATHSSILTWEIPWREDCKEFKTVNLKEINPEYALEGMLLKLTLQYFGYLIQRADSLEKTLMLGKTEGKRKRR